MVVRKRKKKASKLKFLARHAAPLEMPSSNLGLYDRTNFWNSAAISIFEESTKSPNARSTYACVALDVAKVIAKRRPKMTTNEWNELALARRPPAALKKNNEKARSR